MNYLKRSVLTGMAIAAVLGAGGAGACKRDYDVTPAEPAHIASPTAATTQTIDYIITPVASAIASPIPIPSIVPLLVSADTQTPIATSFSELTDAPTSTNSPMPTLEDLFALTDLATAALSPTPIASLTQTQAHRTPTKQPYDKPAPTPFPDPTAAPTPTQKPAAPTPTQKPATPTSTNTPMPPLEVIVMPTASATATLLSPTPTQVYPTPTKQPYNTPSATPLPDHTATPTSTQKPATPTPTKTPVPVYPAIPTPTSIPIPKPKESATSTSIPIKYLTNAEKGQLTGYFEKISHEWDQPSVDAANNILSNKTLGPEAWKPFFQEYFANHALTDKLREYLGYPAFWWFSDTVHANLQQGLYPTLTDIINAQTAAYLKSDRSSFTRDSSIVQSAMNSHRLLNEMVRSQASGVKLQNSIFDFYRDLIDNNPLIYGNDTLDTMKYPFAGALRAQAHMNLVDALQLTDEVRNQVINILKLDGTKRNIFKDYGVLVIDNNGLDKTQLKVIKSMLDSVPSEMYNLTNITVNENLGNTGNKHLWFLNKAGVNIFGVKVGYAVENGFPSDVAPYSADVFSLVVTHELNHRVKVNYIDNISRLREREEALLKQSGSEPQNYLRSMFPAGFFQSAPQEFFASVSNQYFASSEHTLDLALKRFKEGRTEPLNQFLFFADVYSRGGSSTLFFTLDTSGNLARGEVQLGRDSQGRINELNVGANQYKFQLDGMGNVLSANKLQANP